MVRTKRPLINVNAIDPNSSYSVTQLAHLLSAHPETVRRWAKYGRIKAFKPNGYDWRILGTEVLRVVGTVSSNDGVPTKPEFDYSRVTHIYMTPEQVDAIKPGWATVGWG